MTISDMKTAALNETARRTCSTTYALQVNEVWADTFSPAFTWVTVTGVNYPYNRDKYAVQFTPAGRIAEFEKVE